MNKNCHFCKTPPIESHMMPDAVRCPNAACAIYAVHIKVAKWNARADITQDTEEELETAAAIAANKQMALTYFNALWQGIENHIGVDPDCAHWPDVIRSAIGARPAEAVLASAWQPIETAPRDGTWILAFRQGALIPAVVQWQDFKEWPEKFRSVLSPRWIEDIQGQYEDDDNCIDCISGTEYSPTHWKPLDTPEVEHGGK